MPHAERRHQHLALQCRMRIEQDAARRLPADVRTQTLRAFGPGEMAEILGKVKSLTFE